VNSRDKALVSPVKTPLESLPNVCPSAALLSALALLVAPRAALAQSAPLFGPQPGAQPSTARPVPQAEPEQPDPDNIRRRLGFSVVTGGGAALGALSAPVWHAASVRLGVQFHSPFALYLQSQFLLGVVAQANGGGVFLGLHNSALAELSIQNYVQLALGPSVDIVDQRECSMCVLSTAVWFGIHQRVAVPLIARPSFGATRGPRGPARAINIAVDLHENFPAAGVLFTGTVALGIDWY
jgi:hypothetical protein